METIETNVGQWLTDEELNSIADALLFETRLEEKLVYLYDRYAKTNGLAMFDLIDARFVEIKKQFDRAILKEHRGEDGVVRFDYELLPDGTEKMMTMQEMRETTGFPIFSYFPSFFGKTPVSHISWMGVTEIQTEVLAFKAQKVIEEAKAMRSTIAPPVATSTEANQEKKGGRTNDPYNAKVKAKFLEMLIDAGEIEKKTYQNNDKKFTDYATVLNERFGLVVKAGTLENNWNKPLDEKQQKQLRDLFKDQGFRNLAVKAATKQ